jgi:putative phosphoribosyl transferase
VKAIRFKDRRDAGRQLAAALAQYQGQDVVVYALPRGGVVVADEIAKALNAPLDLILAHKIGHPHQSEYAIAAISESGALVGDSPTLRSFGQSWLEKEKHGQMEEFARKRQLYLKGKKSISAQNKIALLVDDGIATGLTMQVGILQLQKEHPRKIIVAIPVGPKSSIDLFKTEVDACVAILAPEDYAFLGSVGAYYDRFEQVEDKEVIAILESYERWKS